MAIDPRLLDPAYYASLPISGDALPWTGGGIGVRGSSPEAYPSAFHFSQLQNLISTAGGQPRGLSGLGFTPFNADYIKNGPGQTMADVGGWGSFEMPLASLKGYFGMDNADPVFSRLSQTARDYLSMAGGTDLLGGGNSLNNGIDFGQISQWTPERVQAQFTPQDYSIIDSAIQPYRTADQMYMQELLRRAQAGDIDIEMSDSGGLFGSLMAAVPGIVGAMSGNPWIGALGGGLSGNLSGGGLQGMLAGALTGGIAGGGGLGNTLNSLGFGGSTGGLMNTITNAISGLTNSNWNPFSIGNIQGLLPSSVLNSTWGTGLSEFLSGAIPGALAGGALDGWEGAGWGGLLGGALGYGANQYGTGGALSLDDWISNVLFGGNNVGGTGATGGSTGGSSGGSSGGAGGGGLFGGGSTGGLFGGGGGSSLLGLLGGAGMLGLLTNEASKVSDTPTGIRTPFSSVNQGLATMDPAIRNTFLGNIANQQGLFNEAGGNQGAYIQARVNPLLQQVAQRRGELERSMGLRGVLGSSFGDQSMTNFDLDSQRALGDARALATNDAIGMRSGLSQQIGAGGDQLFRSELGGLQLADQNIQNLLARAKIRSDIFGRAAAGAAGLLGA